MKGYLRETVAIKKIKILLKKIVIHVRLKLKIKVEANILVQRTHIYPFYYENDVDKSVPDVN